MRLVLVEQFLVKAHVSKDLDASLAESIATDLVLRKRFLLQSKYLPPLLDKVVAKACS